MDTYTKLLQLCFLLTFAVIDGLSQGKHIYVRFIFCVNVYLINLTISWFVSEPTDYCLEDTFTAHCPEGEFITMVSAKYGRMRLGKCIDVDLGKQKYFNTVIFCCSAYDTNIY